MDLDVTGHLLPRRALVLAGAVLLGGFSAGCGLPFAPASLQPTLEIKTVVGGPIAFESGTPVPSFTYQQDRQDLGTGWSREIASLDDRLTFGPRSSVLSELEREAGGRLAKSHVAIASALAISLPDTFDAPAGDNASGAWYYLDIAGRQAWKGRPVYLNFTAVNYIADVWLNGHYVGNHEGGSTPFSLDLTAAARLTGYNHLVVRVARPRAGIRPDVVPWGLTDWWEYGGILGPVWLSIPPALHVVRADVTPHLDGADVATVLDNASARAGTGMLKVEIYPATVTDRNLEDPDARHLISADTTPIATDTRRVALGPGEASHVAFSFTILGADLWTPSSPALFVLHVSVTNGADSSEFYDEFGLRRIQVDTHAPRILLNGQPVVFHGVAVRNEEVYPPQGDSPRGGPLRSVVSALERLHAVSSLHADFIRTDHRPASEFLLMLADRLGFAVWDEIPLYHFAPRNFDLTMRRGVPQQMLAEMVLRDFNHASVLFHGLANESTGDAARRDALRTLSDLDKRLDGSRLTGQAAYGSNPEDTTGSVLDVAGFTFYYGVFYGGSEDRIASATAAALERAHRASPRQPLMIMEFGRWADNAHQETQQADVFTRTYAAVRPRLATEPQGFVSGVTWWSLNDYWTQVPGIQVEHFGAFRASGTERPVAAAIRVGFAESAAGRGVTQPATPAVRLARAAAPRSAGPLLPRLGYAVSLAGGMPLVAIGLLASARRPRRQHER